MSMSIAPMARRNFGLSPRIEVAHNYGLSGPQLRSAEALIRKHEEVIRAAWRKHFGG